MKHIKLFEEFEEEENFLKYRCIKPLPQPFDNNQNNSYCFMNVSDSNKIVSVISELKDMKYREDETVEDTFDIEDIECIKWSISDGEYEQRSEKEYWFSDDATNGISGNWKEVKFDEYFKLKHEYRGHNLKKFGI